MNRKAQLQKELRDIVEAEDRAMVAEHYPIFKKKYEGKYFKSENGYNSDDRWWVYTKVTKINPEDVYNTHGNGVTSHYRGWSFQTYKGGNIGIDQVKDGYVHSLEREISKAEFDKAWNKMIDKLNSMP